MTRINEYKPTQNLRKKKKGRGRFTYLKYQHIPKSNQNEDAEKS
jgi:hypothetical protein